MNTATIYEENKNLIHQVIQTHYPFMVNSNDYNDVFQDGSIGLLKAIESFNENLGYKFSTFAYPAIKNEIGKNIFRYYSNFKVSRGSYHTLLAYNNYKKQGYSFDEITKKLDIDPNRLRNILNAYSENSLEDSLVSDDTFKIRDTISDDYNLEKKVEELYLVATSKVLCKMFLTDLEYTIISNYYGGMTPTKIGNAIKKSATYVCKVVSRVENKIFPAFREYLEGNIKFGELCELLVKSSKKTRSVLKCYLYYSLNNGDDEEFFDDLEMLKSSYGSDTVNSLIRFTMNDGVYYYRVLDILSDTIKILDKYFSTGGIEKKILALLDDDEVDTFWNNFITNHIN